MTKIAAGGPAAEYVVRPPRVGDAQALGALHCRVWQETYAELMEPTALARLDPERFAASWAARLAETDPDGRGPDGEVMRLATLGGAPLAFVSVGPARDDGAPKDRQLWALNVLPEHQGTGLAARLMGEVLGDGPAYLWVAKGNERAIRFYRRHGFAADGAGASDQHAGITEIRMVRPS